MSAGVLAIVAKLQAEMKSRGARYPIYYAYSVSCAAARVVHFPTLSFHFAEGSSEFNASSKSWTMTAAKLNLGEFKKAMMKEHNLESPCWNWLIW